MPAPYSRLVFRSLDELPSRSLEWLTSATGSEKRMSDDGFPSITPKKTWTPDQWVLYRKMPWRRRKLVDVMVLTPVGSRWGAGRAVTYGEKRRARRRGSSSTS